MSVPLPASGPPVESEVPPLVSWHGLRREFLLYLPIWFIYFEAVGLLHAALANFPQEGFTAVGIPRWQFAPPILFPLAWIVPYFVLRIRSSARLQTPWKAYLALFFLTVVVPLATALFYHPHPLSYEQLTVLFEVSQFVWVALLVAHIVLSRGWWAVVMFFGVTFVYGLILENTGIIMHYFYEPRFHLYLGPLPAPLATMLGWCVVFYVTVAVTQHLVGWIPWLGKTIWRRAWTATLLALCLDAQLDPLASISGVFWRWNEQLPPFFLGVPIVNWAAWFGAFLPYTYFVFKILDRESWDMRRKNWELFLRVPLAAFLAGVLWLGVMTLFEGGTAGPTWDILRAFGDRLLPY